MLTANLCSNRDEMQDLSRNGPADCSVARSDEAFAAKRRVALALDFENPFEKRTRIASLSDLALHELTSPTSGQTEDGQTKDLLTPTPTQFLFPKNVTEEQEAYASGFEQALKEIYKEKGPPVTLTTSSAEGQVGLIHSDLTSTSGVCSTASAMVQSGYTMMSQVPYTQAVNQTSFSNPSAAAANNLPANVHFPASSKVSQPGAPIQHVQPGVSGVHKYVGPPEGAAFSASIHGEIQHGAYIHSASGVALNGVNPAGGVRPVVGQPDVNDMGRNWVGLSDATNSDRIVCSDMTAPPIHSQMGAAHTNHAFQNSVRLSHPVHLPGNSQTPANLHVSPQHARTNLPVSAHSQAEANFLARSQGKTAPVHAELGFHNFNAHRMFPRDAGTVPGTGVHQIPGVSTTSNLPWSEASSAAAMASIGAWNPMRHDLPSVGVVNMDEQERLKLERKRAKNRVAAQRCQMRKLERITRLEDKAEKLREQNCRLLQTVDSLRGHIAQLKKQITAHASKGCRMMLPDVPSSINSVGS